MTTSATPTARSVAPTLPGPLAIAAGSAAGVGAGLIADAGTAVVAVGALVSAIAVAAGVPDLRERRIPNVVVLAGSIAAAIVVIAVAVAGDPGVAGRATTGAALGGGLLLLLHLARPAGLGFGDVKLAGALGGAVGVVHWALTAVMLGGAAIVGVAGAVALRSWRRSIPFGTCLGGAALLAVATASWWRDHVGLW